MKSSDKVKVKNVSNRKINLAGGCIEAGKVGQATLAELQCHSKVIEKAVAEKAAVEPAKKKV